MWANRQAPHWGRWQLALICFSPSSTENGITGPTFLHIKKLTQDSIPRPRSHKGEHKGGISAVVFLARNRLASICNFKNLQGVCVCIVCVCVCLFVHVPQSSCGGQKTTSAISPRRPSCSVQGLFVVPGCIHQASRPKSFWRCLCLLGGMLDLQACTTVPLFLHYLLQGFELRSSYFLAVTLPTEAGNAFLFISF